VNKAIFPGISLPMQTVLTIAGFDPSSGAGVTADLLVFAAHGLFGTSCITNLTVQSTVGVVATNPVAPDIVTATLLCLQSDVPPDAIKIGMLSTQSTVIAVADYLAELREQGCRIPVILDPIVRSSSGRELLDPDGVKSLREQLLPLIDWITPNLDELGVLTNRPVVGHNDLIPAAHALQQMGRSVNVLATGGHLDPPDDLLLTVGGEVHWLRGDHIASTSTHGTGCALSSALTSNLVLGLPPLAAAQAAKEYVAGAIRTAEPIGRGLGPLNHLWLLQQQ
jgi:hydroxymethylpyrimidine/phosphomethylpyrimidine kinase